MYVDDESSAPDPTPGLVPSPATQETPEESFLDRRGPRIALGGLAVAILVSVAGVLGFDHFKREQRRIICERDMEAAEEWQELIESCGSPLPPNSTRVPPSVPRGVAINSSPGDWKQVATRCGSREFSVSGPQLHSFRWERLADLPSGGEVVIEADLNGDGTVDHRARFAVICDQRGCLVGDAMEDGYCDPAPD